jgi:Protein of unknown function (DUF2934)
MSRAATPPLAQPHGPTAAGLKIPPEKIAMRAYEKWLKRGCTHGHDMQDWIEAEAELRTELSRTQGMPGMGQRR